MANAIVMTDLAGAVVASVTLAVWLEWLCLRALMQLMPARAMRLARPSQTRAGSLRVSSPGLHV